MGIAGLRASNGNHPDRDIFTFLGPTAKDCNILYGNGPHGVALVDGTESCNLGADITGGVRPVKILHFHILQVGRDMLADGIGKTLTRTEGDKKVALSQRGQSLQSSTEVFFPALHDKVVIGCEGGTVKTAHHNGFRGIVWVGNCSKGALAQQGPQPLVKHALAKFSGRC